MMTTKTIKCPLDGRLFATRRALQQHRAEVHGNTVVKPQTNGGNPAPRRNRRVRKNSQIPRMLRKANTGQSVVFAGSDLIGSAVVSDTTPQGSALLAWDVSPAMLANTRVFQFAKVYTRWRPRKLVLTCVPGAGMFTPGSYAMGWTADPKFYIGDASSRLTRVLALSPNCIMSTFGQPKSLNIPCDTTQKWYLTEITEGAETDHGMVIAILAAIVGGKNITLNFKLDWEIEFDSPDLPAPAEEFEIYPDPTFIPIFTDSVSDWQDGKKLTFKHKEGGSVVPFVGVKDNVVYKPAKGVTVPYVKSDETEGTVKALAKIKDSPVYTSAMACFSSESDAKAYVKSGDVTKILDYKSAGNYVTPDFPTFVGQTVAEPALLDLTRAFQRCRIAPYTKNWSKPVTMTQYYPSTGAPAVNSTFDGATDKPHVNIQFQQSAGPSFAVDYTATDPSFNVGWPSQLQELELSSDAEN